MGKGKNLVIGKKEKPIINGNLKKIKTFPQIRAIFLEETKLVRLNYGVSESKAYSFRIFTDEPNDEKRKELFNEIIQAERQINEKLQPSGLTVYLNMSSVYPERGSVRGEMLKKLKESRSVYIEEFPVKVIYFQENR